jgi:hypothetical protein
MSHVPRLGVAAEFFKCYAALEPAIQRATDEAIRKFREHTHAGLHLEKLTGARDPRLRTIRITLGWRGVVLAPASGDEYYLIAVVKHDVADRELARRRYTVNHALGVLETRDQGAIETLTPAYARAAEGSEERLFDGVKDGALIQLGVDAELLPLVRALTSVAQLEALAKLMPQRQYDVLYGLASGYSPDEVWRQVSQYLVDTPTEVDPNDLAAAVERTPDQYVLVSGPDELTAMLAEPFQTWRIFLHPRQRELAYRPSHSGPVLVTGGPGTGKTVTAVHRAAFLAERYRDTDGPAPILLTTFTRNLAEALERQLALLVSDARIRSRIDVLNVDRLAHRVVADARGGKPAVVAPGELARLWQDAAATTGGEFSRSFLEREWEQVVLAEPQPSRAAYLASPRRGRGKPLRGAARERAWAAMATVIDTLRERGEWTHLQLAAEAAGILADRGTPPYRHVIVDEGQDLHPAQWRLLRAAVASGHNDLFIVADPNQRIYDNRVSLESLAIRVRGRSRRLTVSYRTTQEILTWSARILAGEPAEGLDDDPDALAGYHSEMHGRRPTVREFANRDAEIAGLIEQIREWLAGGIEPSAIGIGTRTTHQATEVRQALQGSGISAISARSKCAEGVHVDTMHKMKGLEFRCAALVNIDDPYVPLSAALTDADEDPISHQQDLQRERCLLFVACTRARDTLYVSHLSGRASRFLPAAVANVS